MAKKIYLPQWTDGYDKYDNQYLAANIILNDDISRESLLPVRFKDDLTLFGGDNIVEEFKVGKIYSKPGDWCMAHYLYMKDAGYEFARKIYKAAVARLFEECSDIEKIKIGNQRENGVYPIHWVYPVDYIRERLLAIIKEIIDEGFFVTEHVEFSEYNDRIIRFDGVIQYDERVKLFGMYKFNSIPDVFNGKITYSFDKCMEYYVDIPEDILELGNQRRVYNILYEKNKVLFDLAKQGNISELCTLAEKGYDINAMNEAGDTPLYIYVERFLYNIENKEESFPCHIKQNIEKLISCGANPAIFGITNYHCNLIQQACICSNSEVVEFWLEKGVNPNMYMCLDDYTENGCTLLDWCEDHAEWDEFCDEDERELEMLRINDMKKICCLLRKYM